MQLYRVDKLKNIGLYLPITVILLVLTEPSLKMIVLAAIGICNGTIMKHPWVVPSTHRTCKTLTTPLCHTNLRIGRVNPEILTNILTFDCWWSWKEDQLVLLFFCPNSLPNVLTLLYLHSYLSLNFSSSTCCIYLMALLCTCHILACLPYFPYLKDEATKQQINSSFSLCH